MNFTFYVGLRVRTSRVHIANPTGYPFHDTKYVHACIWGQGRWIMWLYRYLSVTLISAGWITPARHEAWLTALWGYHYGPLATTPNNKTSCNVTFQTNTYLHAFYSEAGASKFSENCIYLPNYAASHTLNTHHHGISKCSKSTTGTHLTVPVALR
jgi:hypothetical protein